jgi:cell volume regulation protein A
MGTRLLMAQLMGIGEQLLILVVSIAFMAYGLGNFFGGGGLVAVFTAGLVMASQSGGKKEPSHSSPQHHHSAQNDKSVQISTNQYKSVQSHHQSLQQVLLPFNTTSEFTILLLLGLLVYLPDLLAVLPLVLVTALLLVLVVRPATVGLLGWGSILNSREWLLVACCGMGSAITLALSVNLLEEVLHLCGVPPQMAEALASNLSALVFAVVLINLLLQGLLVPRLLPRLAALPMADRLRTASEINSDDPASNLDWIRAALKVLI